MCLHQGSVLMDLSQQKQVIFSLDCSITNLGEPNEILYVLAVESYY